MGNKDRDNNVQMNADVKVLGELDKPVATAEPAPAEPKKDKAEKGGKQYGSKKSDRPNIFKRMGKGIKGVISELKKVTWPKGKDVGKSTAVVAIVVVAFFLILFCVDYVLTGLYTLVMSGEWATLFI